MALGVAPEKTKKKKKKKKVLFIIKKKKKIMDEKSKFINTYNSSSALTTVVYICHLKFFYTDTDIFIGGKKDGLKQYTLLCDFLSWTTGLKKILK